MAFALVANVAASTPDLDGSNVTTGAIDTTGADLIVISIASYGNAGAPSDSKGNTWTALTAQGTPGGSRQRLFYAYSPSVGSGHTFSSSGGGYPSICVVAFSGAASSPFDQQNGAIAAQPGSVTPTENNELVVSGLTFYPAGTISINSSFTITNQQNYVAGYGMGCALAYLIQSSAGAVNPTWSTSSSFTEVASAIATFKAASGATASIVPLIMHMARMRVGQ